MQDIEKLRESLLADVSAAADLDAVERVRIAALGRKGVVTERMKALRHIAPEERREAGIRLNALKDEVSGAIDARKAELAADALAARLAAERVDVTLPVRPEAEGRIHPVSQVLDEIVAIFGDMGYAIAEGPDIEDDFHNFTALNIPPEHPARQEHDTFYFAPGPDGARKLLRTHTSPVQVRTMRNRKPPLRLIAPGRTYRCDSDVTHTPMFHQVEGLVVDKTTHMGHLKGCLQDFVRAFFEVDDVPVRFRPSYFPFTSPSAEMDIGCTRKRGELRIGGGDDLPARSRGSASAKAGWLEILGCGMVHPNVLANCGIDPDAYQGFAFGMGIDRIAMLKYGIADLRSFFDADLRWLRHYGFLALDVPSLPAGLAR
ncbi:MAG: phenylalanine--tRNA ligase subunit alpha [Alphaproteobacteria bacterium]